jgi:N-acetylglucosaminyl-diphospho-decaprenol L-rhamnosyltransferase
VSAQVAIAVVSWNTRDLLAACLMSLAADHESGLAQVWVVDNASSDGSADLVRDRFPWVRLLALDENLGFGPAVDEVADRTSTAWVAAANADLEFGPDALERMLDAGRRDPGAGIVAPRLVLPDGSTQHSVHAFPTIPKTLVLSAAVERWSPRAADRLAAIGRFDVDRRRRVDWAHGAFLLIRREAWDAIGGFDRDQWMYAEDLDIAWRAARAGWASRYEPTARVTHAVSAATAKAWGDDRARRSTAASYAWLERRRGVPRARATAAINCAAAALKAGLARSSAERERQLWHLRLHRLGLRSRRDMFPPG